MAQTVKIYQVTLDNLVSNDGKSVFFRKVSEYIPNNPFALSYGELALAKDSSETLNIVTSSSLTLKEIHIKRSRKSIFLLVSSVIFISIFGILVVLIVIKALENNSEVPNHIKLISTVLSVVSALFGSGLLILYNKENDSLQKIEQDMQYLNKLATGLSLIDKISSDSQLKEEVISSLLKVA